MITNTTLSEPEAIRFWAKVDRPSLDGCWTWRGSLNGGGYGRFGLRRAEAHAHRLSFALLVEPIPAGMMLDHRCHNRACCNPTHLRIATARQNQHNREGKATGRYSSRFPGVDFHRPSGKFRARIMVNGRTRQLGRFTNEREAADVLAEFAELAGW